MRNFNTEYRLLLTGTPLQNNLHELVSSLIVNTVRLEFDSLKSVFFSHEYVIIAVGPAELSSS